MDNSSRNVPANLERSGELVGASLEPLLSTYLVAGLPQESHEILSIEIKGKLALARCRIGNTFTGGEGATSLGGHLSFYNAAILTGLVQMTHALYLEGFDRKTVEVLLNDFSISCPSLIRNYDELTIRSEVYSRRLSASTKPGREPVAFYRMRFEICDLWCGHRTMCFNVPALTGTNPTDPAPPV